MCIRTCSPGCKDGTCNQLGGSCTCSDNWTGHLCDGKYDVQLTTLFVVMTFIYFRACLSLSVLIKAACPFLH